MFCDKCGKQNPDEARFCEQCGNTMPVISADDATEPAANENFTPIPSISTDKNAMTALIGIIVCVVVLIAGVWGVSRIFGGNNSPEKPIQLMVKAMNKGDVDILIKAFPKELQEILDDNSFVKKTLKSTFKDACEEIDGKIKYTVIDKDHCSDAEVENYEDNLNSSFIYMDDDVDHIKVQDAYEYEIKLEYKNADGDKETETVNLVVYKIKGKWYLTDF